MIDIRRIRVYIRQASIRKTITTNQDYALVYPVEERKDGLLRDSFEVAVTPKVGDKMGIKDVREVRVKHPAKVYAVLNNTTPRHIIISWNSTSDESSLGLFRHLDRLSEIESSFG
ncbi:hypothetical protein Y032_0126g1335 [Ancylostoma ceylanicum]|uniref:Uncharacterized protein n=1 Tax=Ancylostoma ceylanicum TaxID=53326 RepID=A0A016T8I2_9BILA|nr:hypothetical protein Y032_0126g1335 [Ancylostoma ceylanicum]